MLERTAYSCSRCGWIRNVSVGDEWLKSIIHHPLYGTVSQARLVAIDIVTHKNHGGCDAYLKRIAKLQEIDRAREMTAA